jgi:hypothetical protein
VSLIVAGATLAWKRIQLINDTVLMLVMLFSGPHRRSIGARISERAHQHTRAPTKIA